MCNVWKSSATDRIQSQHLLKLPPSLRTVNLSGGEPFLREDLPELLAAVRRRCPRAVVTISTNAYLHERILEMLPRLLEADKNVRLAVSLDGMGEAHDAVRGDAGAFERARRLLDGLAERNFCGVRLGMTLSEQNLDQLLAVADFARRRELELGIVAAHAARTHLDVEVSAARLDLPEGLREDFQTLARRWLRSWRPRLWLRAHFAMQTWRWMAGRPWRTRCRAGEDFFFCRADGEVFHCSVEGRSMGNLVDEPWERIWTGERARTARQAARHCPRACWMICTARAVYRRRAPDVAAWVLRNKLAAHRGASLSGFDRPPAGDAEAKA
jgi:MoaA/NifB/PqqE/SkfB family radical SAM enzyme